MDWDIPKRHQQILGGPERLSFVSKDALDVRHHEILAQLRVYFDYDDEPMFDTFFATLAHSPEFFAHFAGMGVAVALHSGLPVRLREMAILRTAWLKGAPYAWGEHVFATRRGVFESTEIERIIAGPDAPEWEEVERAVLQAADDLHHNAVISDATWAILAQHLDEKQLLELPLIIGHYTTTAYLQNTMRSRLSDYCDGLNTR